MCQRQSQRLWHNYVHTRSRPSPSLLRSCQAHKSACAGEKIWRMPMEDSYWEQMKSPIADMKNTGGRMGGAITAALFLREYVDTEKVPLL